MDPLRSGPDWDSHESVGRNKECLFVGAISGESPRNDACRQSTSLRILNRDDYRISWQVVAMQKLTPEDEMLDLEARCLLLEDDIAKKQEAVRLLKQRYERPLMAFLGELFGDIEADERAMVVNDALLEIYRRSVKGTLDANNELSGLLFTVAKRRGIDRRRRNSRRIPVGSKLAENVGDYLKDTGTGSDWRLAVIMEHAAAITDEFRAFVRTLTAPQQKRVASVMADALPDWMTDREIADDVFERFGVHVSQLEVKGAKQALMKKFRELMKKKRQ